MKKSAKILSLLLAVIFLVSALAACGGNPAESTKPNDTQTQKPADSDGNDRNNVKDTVPTDLKFPNETVTFYVRNDADIYLYELACDELKNDTLYDAIHYRNIDVENRLGLKIRTVGQPGTYSDATTWNQTFSTSVLTNTGDYDAAAFYLSTGSPMAKDGIFYNVLNLTSEYGDGYFNFSKPWWNQTMVDELTVYGAMFFVGGDLTISETAAGYGLFFNKDIFNRKFPEIGTTSLYQTVRDGKWTIDKMTDFVSQAWEDTNNNGVIDDGDTVGIRTAAIGNSDGQMDAWIYAMGLELTTKNEFGEPVLALLNNGGKTVSTYETVRKLISGNPGALLLNDSNKTETAFKNNNQLFANYFLRTGASLRESTINYGIIPLPKLNEDQEEYHSAFGNSGSAIGIASCLKADRAAMVSAVMEVLAAESYKQVTPAYYETVLQGQYSKEEADAEMYDMILKSFVFSFGYAYSTKSLGGVGSIFRDMSPSYDIQTTLESKKTSWETNLAELLTALEEHS